MSKQAQQKESTFAAGRGAYLDSKNYYDRYGKNIQDEPTFVEWITDQQKQNNPFKRTEGLRKVWDAGFVAGLKGLRSNKIKKAILKRDLSRVNGKLTRITQKASAVRE